MEPDGEDGLPDLEGSGVIRGPLPARRGVRGASPEPTWGGEIECDEEPDAPSRGPQADAPDEDDNDVTMEYAW